MSEAGKLKNLIKNIFISFQIALGHQKSSSSLCRSNGSQVYAKQKFELMTPFILAFYEWAPNTVLLFTNTTICIVCILLCVIFYPFSTCSTYYVLCLQGMLQVLKNLLLLLCDITGVFAANSVASSMYTATLFLSYC